MNPFTQLIGLSLLVHLCIIGVYKGIGYYRMLSVRIHQKTIYSSTSLPRQGERPTEGPRTGNEGDMRGEQRQKFQGHTRIP